MIIYVNKDVYNFQLIFNIVEKNDKIMSAFTVL
jgi:hypothetical protein